MSSGTSSGRGRSPRSRTRYSARTATCCFSTFTVNVTAPLRHWSRKIRRPTGPTVPTVKRSRSPRSNVSFTVRTPPLRESRDSRDSRDDKLRKARRGVHAKHVRSGGPSHERGDAARRYDETLEQVE